MLKYVPTLSLHRPPFVSYASARNAYKEIPTTMAAAAASAKASPAYPDTMS